MSRDMPGRVSANGHKKHDNAAIYIRCRRDQSKITGAIVEEANGKGIPFVNANDIFNWNSWGNTNNSPYVVSTSNSKYNSRSVSVGVTFRFGKMELEQRARQGGDDSQGAPEGMGGM